MTEATRRRLLLAGRVAFAAVIGAVLVLAAADRWDQLRSIDDLRVTPGWLLLGAPFTLVGGLLLPLAWRHVLGAYGERIGRRTAVRVWSISQASRFVPGNVAWIASRVMLAGREGVARRITGASLAVEAGLILSWGAAFSALLPSSVLATPLRVLLAVAAVGVMVALPFVLRLVHRLVPIGQHRVRDLYEAVALYGVNDLARCVGWIFVTAAVHPIGSHDVWLVIGAANAGMAVGMVGITPAGLGVREGVIAAALAGRFGLGEAATLAILYRAWDFAFELAWLGVALRWGRPRPDPLAAGV